MLELLVRLVEPHAKALDPAPVQGAPYRDALFGTEPRERALGALRKFRHKLGLAHAHGNLRAGLRMRSRQYRRVELELVERIPIEVVTVVELILDRQVSHQLPVVHLREQPGAAGVARRGARLGLFCRLASTFALLVRGRGGGAGTRASPRPADFQSHAAVVGQEAFAAVYAFLRRELPRQPRFLLESVVDETFTSIDFRRVDQDTAVRFGLAGRISHDSNSEPRCARHDGNRYQPLCTTPDLRA